MRSARSSKPTSTTMHNHQGRGQEKMDCSCSVYFYSKQHEIHLKCLNWNRRTTRDKDTYVQQDSTGIFRLEVLKNHREIHIFHTTI